MADRSDSLNNGIYIVVANGPVDIQTRQYAWIVMSDPTRSFSFVLASNINDYRNFYEGEVRNYMLANGFDQVYNRPEPVEQGGSCEYISPDIY